MTVPYTQSVSTARIGGFFRLLFRWRGSIYQVIYGETIIFIIFYYALNLSYRWWMKGTKWQTGFEAFAKYCEGFADFIPVTFVLGFYVVHACARRWTQWENLPWPDKFAFDISGHMVGSDARTLMLRRTLIRYANVASVLCYRDISIAVRKRFPTLQHLVEAGLMSQTELEQFKKTSTSKDTNWWIPFHWAYNLIYRAKIEGIVPEGSANKLQDDVLDMRQKCWVLFSHDWIPIPMVYTQVATLAVYLFMLASLFGRQYVVKKEGSNHVDLFVPVFPFLQVIFYLGWLKVGEVLTNPFGGDADDFEMNYVIDRNLRISYTIVDEHYNTVPPIEKDMFWNVEPEVPHTQESSGLRTDGFIGSAVCLDKPDQPPSDTNTVDSGTPVSRSNSIRTTMRARTQAITRPLSRLLSRASDRDRLNEQKLLESAEKGDDTPTGSGHASPRVSPSVNRRNKPTTFQGSHPSRLPSIVEIEGSENLLDFMLAHKRDSASLQIGGDSKTGSLVTTPTAVPVIGYFAVLEDVDGDIQEKASNEKSPLLASTGEESGVSESVPGTTPDAERPTTFERWTAARGRDIKAIDEGESREGRVHQRRLGVSLPDISKKTLMERHTSLDL